MARASHTADQLNSTSAKRPPASFFVEVFLGLGILVTSLTMTYFVWRLPAALAGVAFVGWLVWLVYRASSADWRLPRCEWGGLGLASVAFAADLLIVVALCQARTSAVLISPWDAVNALVFPLFALATGFALAACRRLGWGWGGILAFLHLLVAFSVSAIVYRIGFGYDPFVHEAATSYIFAHGFILPKQPFYIGQYGLVIAISWITRLGIHAVQTALVPICAAAGLVMAAYVRSTSSDEGFSPAAALGLFLLMPFAPFAFTVPYNLALVFLVVVILLLPCATTRTTRVAVWSMAIAALCIHPLIGIPACGLVFVSSLRVKGWKTLAVSFVTSAVSLVGALFVYARTNGGSLSWPGSAEFAQVVHAFIQPVFTPLRAYPIWTALYGLYYLWLPLLFILGFVCLLRNRRVRSQAMLTVGCAFGCVLASIITALTVRFRNIISYEQMEFSLRLLQLAPWLVIGGTLSMLRRAEQRMPRAALIGMSLFALLTWFIAYPTFTPVYSVYSPGIGQVDLDTVTRIQQLAAGKPYVALTPQMTSAAALHLIGFEQSLSSSDGNIYPYAIPTGGYLYGKYFSLFYGSDPLTNAREAANYGHVQLVFLAIPWAWDPYGNILKEMNAAGYSNEWLGDRWLFVLRFPVS